MKIDTHSNGYIKELNEIFSNIHCGMKMIKFTYLTYNIYGLVSNLKVRNWMFKTDIVLIAI